MNELERIEELFRSDVKIATLILYQGSEIHREQLEDLIGIYDNEELSTLLGDEELFRDKTDHEIHDYFDENLLGCFLAEVHTPVKKPFGRRTAMSWSWGLTTRTLMFAKDMNELIKKSCEWADKKEDEYGKAAKKERRGKKMIDPEIKYYFCETEGGRGVPTFFITPKEYYDAKGFLLDSGSFDPKIDKFERVADSTFEYVGKEINPENILLKNGQYMWRDMGEEISYLYRRRRLLGIDDQE